MKKTLLTLLNIILCLLPLSAQRTSRDYIREQIRFHGECRNVAITKFNGDLMLYGRNGCARSGCPQGLNDAITELNEKGEYIDDIQLTEAGRYLILYGNNGIVWNNIPYALEQKLREYNDKREVILSVTFNDAGNWIVITSNYFSSSHAEVNKWLQDGNESYGHLWAACITDDAIIAVYAEGYKFIGNVPESLKTALTKTKLDVFRLKLAGNAWFFADKNGNYQYNM